MKIRVSYSFFLVLLIHVTWKQSDLLSFLYCQCCCCASPSLSYLSHLFCFLFPSGLQQYGDIRTLYTACKHRGFVMISYYDIRAARTAMRSLQNKPLRRRKLDIHFSIPKVLNTYLTVDCLLNFCLVS